MNITVKNRECLYARARTQVPEKNRSRTHQFAQVAFRYIFNIVNR
jgi:hypothetical protein